MTKNFDLPKRIKDVQGNLSQKEFANALGVSQPKISRWLSGTGEPSASELVRIAQFAGITVQEVLFGQQAAEVAQEPSSHPLLRLIHSAPRKAVLAAVHAGIERLARSSPNSDKMTFDWIENAEMSNIGQLIRQAIAQRFDLNDPESFRQGLNQFMGFCPLEEEGDREAVRKLVRKEAPLLPDYLMEAVAWGLRGFLGINTINADDLRRLQQASPQHNEHEERLENGNCHV